MCHVDFLVDIILVSAVDIFGNVIVVERTSPRGSSGKEIKSHRETGSQKSPRRAEGT